MAVSGGCCGGYIYEMRGGVLVVVRGETRLRSACDTVTEAVVKLRRGEPATVVASDALALREAMTGKGEQGQEEQGEEVTA